MYTIIYRYESSCHVWLHGPWTISFAQWLCPCGQCDHQPVFKTITWLLLSLEPSEPCLRNLHQHAPEPSGTCLRNLHQHAPELSGICRNPPEPSGTCFWNLHQHTPELAGTLRNPKPTPAPELPGTLRHSAELSGTLRNLPLEPPPAHTGTPPELPEPLSGTCSCDPHRHTPELVWAEDPISLRCWGKNIWNRSREK